MVQNLRERSGLDLEEALTELEEKIVHPSIPRHEHPHLHAFAEGLRKRFGITGKTPSERIKNILGSLHSIVESRARAKKEEFGAVPEERVMPPRRRIVPEVEAEKVTVGSGDVFDVGDVEGIRIGEDVVITIPKGKNVYLITRGRGIVPTTAKKLNEVV